MAKKKDVCKEERASLAEWIAIRRMDLRSLEEQLERLERVCNG